MQKEYKLKVNSANEMHHRWITWKVTYKTNLKKTNVNIFFLVNLKDHDRMALEFRYRIGLKFRCRMALRFMP